MKAAEMVGKKFGRLTVIEVDESNNSKCICRCDCGTIKSVYTSNVRRGLTTSCGCYSREIHSQVKEDLTGKTFGRLTVISRAENKGSDVQWLCHCNCGNSIVVASKSLKSGNTKSCGCLKSELTSQRFSMDITGERFGKLTVIRRNGTFAGEDGTQYSQWLCKCDCGTYKTIRGHDLVSGRVTSCGCMASRGEEEVRAILNKLHVQFETQFYFKNLKSDKGWPLRFDFALFKDDKLVGLIEYQGIQHYIEQPMGFGKQQREVTDKAKRDYCQSNNIPLFEIMYNDNIEQKVNSVIKELQI